MHISDVKRELYNELKKDFAVTGAGICELNGSEAIIIYISTPEISSAVPTEYKGIKVITEVSEDPKMV